jgi:prepilin-type N-terminal cleavage/methylation domain-containing protein
MKAKGTARMVRRLKKRFGKRGFTIIEVLIVLAIAALILVIVFLAVPTLQRSARNTTREADASAIAAAVSNYISDNAGQLPSGLASDSTHTNVLLIGTNDQFIGTPSQGNSEEADLGFYNIDTANQIYGGSTWYANGMGPQANILSDDNNVLIVALKSTATQISIPTVVSSTTAPSLPSGNGGPNSGGTINTLSVTIIPGETCPTIYGGTGVVQPATAAIFYVLEGGSGNGNLKCIEQ